MKKGQIIFVEGFLCLSLIFGVQSVIYAKDLPHNRIKKKILEV